jgi:hypothetical protein
VRAEGPGRQARSRRNHTGLYFRIPNIWIESESFMR